MRTSVILGVCTLLVLMAADARAQWTAPLDGRLTIGVNGGGQTGSLDVSPSTTFGLYGEEARVDTRQTISTGGVFDIGAAYRIGLNWGFGLGYSASSGSGDALVDGSLPHPLVFGQNRAFSVSAAGLDTRERAIHLQAVLFVPFVENVDFTFAAGPSFYRVEQDFTTDQGFRTGAAFSEVPPTFDSVTISPLDVVSVSQSGTGVNISGDVTYRFLEHVGAGLVLRYTRATLDLNLGDGTSVEVRPGGFQALVGVRLRF